MKLELLTATQSVVPPEGTIFEPVYLGSVVDPMGDDRGLSFANSYSSTFTCNATGYYEVICIGGGQGAVGGDDNPVSNAGAGGDSGAGALNVQYLVSGSSYSYTIGGAGAGEARLGTSSLQRGSASTFNGLLAAGGHQYDDNSREDLKLIWSEGGPDQAASGSYNGSTNGGGGTSATNTTYNYVGRVFSQLDPTITHGAGGTSYGGSWGGSGGGGGFSSASGFLGSASPGDNRVGTPSPQGGTGYGAGGGGGAGNHGNARSVTRGGRGARGYIRLKYLGITPNTTVYTTVTPTIANVRIANVELTKSNWQHGLASGAGFNDKWGTIIFNPYSANAQQARTITTLTDGSNSSANAVNISDNNTGAIWITLDKIPTGDFTMRVTTVSDAVGRYHIGASNYVGNGRFVSQVLRTDTAPLQLGPYPGVRDTTIPGGYKYYFITGGITTGENNGIQDIRIV